MTRFNYILVSIATLSVCFLVAGLVILTDSGISHWLKIIAAIFVQLGGAFFFALTAGYISEKIHNIKGYSGLWLFSEEFRKAGVLDFYSNRYGNAEISLRDSFNNHRKGEVLIAGVSLRVFFVEGQPFYSSVKKMLESEGSTGITVKALTCDPERNYELPFRSFIEEFNQDRSFPLKKSSRWDWGKLIDFSFDSFEGDFFKTHGIHALMENKVRIVRDLEATSLGIRVLQGIASNVKNSIEHRYFKSAPYCTVIIFPEKAFCTPNILYTDSPANFPMIVFHKSSDVYEKLTTYFRFLWWLNNPKSGSLKTAEIPVSAQ